MTDVSTTDLSKLAGARRVPAGGRAGLEPRSSGPGSRAGGDAGCEQPRRPPRTTQAPGGVDMLTVVALVVGLGVGAVVAAVWLRAASSSAVRRARTSGAGSSPTPSARRRRSAARRSSRRVRAPSSCAPRSRARSGTVASRSRRSRSGSPSARPSSTQKLIEVTRREQGVGDREVHLKQLQDERRRAATASLGSSSESPA